MAEAFDTHKAYLELTNGDRFEHAQAEALIALVNGAVVGSLAMKSDIEILENKLDNGMATLRSELENGMTTLRSELEILESKLDNGMTTLRSELEILENKLDNGMTTLRSELENGMTTLRSEIENGMTTLRSEIKNSAATLRSEIEILENKLENVKNYLLFRLVLAQFGMMGILFGLIKFFD